MREAFDSRPWVVAPTALLLAAWAGIGIATGHMPLSVGRGVLQFQGAPALVLSLAGLAAACALPLGVNRRRARRGLMWVCLGLLVLALALKVLDGRSPQVDPLFSGLATEHALRLWLDQPRLAAWGSQAAAAATTWLALSCAALLIVALLARWVGVAKASSRNAPLLTLGAAVVFGSPFLAWFTLEWLPYLFKTLPARQPAGSFMADAALALSMLGVLLWLWWLVGLALGVTVLSACGFRFRWDSGGVHHKLAASVT